jgi:hypothetical protein
MCVDKGIWLDRSRFERVFHQSDGFQLSCGVNLFDRCLLLA